MLRSEAKVKRLTDMLGLLLEKSITERSMCESTNHFSLLNFIDFRAQRWALYYCCAVHDDDIIKHFYSYRYTYWCTTEACHVSENVQLKKLITEVCRSRYHPSWYLQAPSSDLPLSMAGKQLPHSLFLQKNNPVKMITSDGEDGRCQGDQSDGNFRVSGEGTVPKT